MYKLLVQAVGASACSRLLSVLTLLINNRLDNSHRRHSTSVHPHYMVDYVTDSSTACSQLQAGLHAMHANFLPHPSLPHSGPSLSMLHARPLHALRPSASCVPLHHACHQLCHLHSFSALQHTSSTAHNAFTSRHSSYPKASALKHSKDSAIDQFTSGPVNTTHCTAVTCTTHACPTHSHRRKLRGVSWGRLRAHTNAGGAPHQSQARRSSCQTSPGRSPP